MSALCALSIEVVMVMAGLVLTSTICLRAHVTLGRTTISRAILMGPTLVAVVDRRGTQERVVLCM